MGLAATLILAEGVYRLAFQPDNVRKNIATFRAIALGTPEGLYVPDAGGGYHLNPARKAANRWGFLGPEVPIERREGIPRLAFLGGSTTESGNDRSWRGSYPYFAGEILHEALHRKVEILNFGVAGWTTMPYRDHPDMDPVLRRGMEEHNAILRAIAAANDVLLIDLARLDLPDAMYERDEVHKTPEGNRRLAQAIAGAILDHGLLAATEATGPRETSGWEDPAASRALGD